VDIEAIIGRVDPEALVFGPAYNRAAAEHVAAARRFVERGDWPEAAEHHALLALVATGVISWEEFVERDPFRAEARGDTIWIVESGSSECLAEHNDAAAARQDATNRRARLVRRVEVNGELVEDALIHDFGAESEVTEGDLIYRTVFEVEVFSRSPLPDGLSLADIQYEIDEGDCIGDYRRTSVEIVPHDALEDHLLRIGNDGTFFKDAP
jgi:hypothetical protein